MSWRTRRRRKALEREIEDIARLAEVLERHDMEWQHLHGVMNDRLEEWRALK